MADSFTPNSANGGSNSYANLNAYDLDMGTGGVMIFYSIQGGVETRYLLTMDKSGYAYLLNPSNLRYFPNDRHRTAGVSGIHKRLYK